MHTWCWPTSILLSRLSLARTDWNLKAANVHTSLADWVLVNSLVSTALENLVLNSSLNAFASHKVNIFLILLPNKNPPLFSGFVSLPSSSPTNKWSQEILHRRLCEKKLGMWRLQLSEMSSWMEEHGTRGHRMFSYSFYFLLSGLGSPLLRKLAWCLLSNFSMYIIKETDLLLKNQEPWS